MSTWIPVIVAILGSNGLFVFIQFLINRHDATVDLLRGLAHDRIKYLSMEYIARGYITEPELEELSKYLYEPYKKAKGNGTIELIYNQAIELPIRPQ